MSVAQRVRGGGRFLNLGDVGKSNVVISTKIARDCPNADAELRASWFSLRAATAACSSRRAWNGSRPRASARTFVPRARSPSLTAGSAASRIRSLPVE